MQRGLDRQSYSCAPQCLPTAKLGDDVKYFGDVSGEVKDHNAQPSASIRFIRDHGRCKTMYSLALPHDLSKLRNHF